MVKATMCSYPQSNHSLPYFKCVFQCCSKFQSVNLPYQETYDQYSGTRPSDQFHVYSIISRFTTHGRLLLHDKKICRMCKQDSYSEQSTKIYTRKELVMM